MKKLLAIFLLLILSLSSCNNEKKPLYEYGFKEYKNQCKYHELIDFIDSATENLYEQYKNNQSYFIYYKYHTIDKGSKNYYDKNGNLKESYPFYEEEIDERFIIYDAKNKIISTKTIISSPSYDNKWKSKTTNYQYQYNTEYDHIKINVDKKIFKFGSLGLGNESYGFFKQYIEESKRPGLNSAMISCYIDENLATSYIDYGKDKNGNSYGSYLSQFYLENDFYLNRYKLVDNDYINDDLVKCSITDRTVFIQMADQNLEKIDFKDYKFDNLME